VASAYGWEGADARGWSSGHALGRAQQRRAVQQIYGGRQSAERRDGATRCCKRRGSQTAPWAKAMLREVSHTAMRAKSAASYLFQSRPHGGVEAVGGAESGTPDRLPRVRAKGKDCWTTACAQVEHSAGWVQCSARRGWGRRSHGEGGRNGKSGALSLHRWQEADALAVTVRGSTPTAGAPPRHGPEVWPTVRASAAGP
jgi:hypothetical protein